MDTIGACDVCRLMIVKIC